MTAYNAFDSPALMFGDRGVRYPGAVIRESHRGIVVPVAV